jgi:mRNA interferase MazF
VTPRYVPDVGDLVWLDAAPHAGHEQVGTRPALVLSPREYNHAAGLALVCPITTKAKGYPFEVPLPAGLPVQGVVLADQVRSVDYVARRARNVATAPSAATEEAREKLRPLLGL